MPDILLLLGAGIATALATGLGAIPVFFLGERAKALRPGLIGLAVGLMSVASVVGLLLPALHEGAPAAVAAGVATGVLFLLLTGRVLAGRDVHFGELRGAGVGQSLLVFAVLFVHSLPEGMAMGTAYASNRAGLGLFVILAIGLQNVPEGTSVAIPMATAGFSRPTMFWAGAATSSPQPLAAPLAFLAVEQVRGLLPFSFSFAAGAMLALVATELIPDAYKRGTRVRAALGTALGASLMLGLSSVLGV